MRKQIARGLLCVLHAALISGLGCGGTDDDRPRRHPVSGVIQHHGQPVEGATVMFVPVEGPHAAVGKTDHAGRYTLTTFDPGDGAVAGDYEVTVVKYEMPDLSAEPVEDGEEPPVVFLLPERFAAPETSGLTASVTQAGPNTFDFQLD